MGRGRRDRPPTPIVTSKVPAASLPASQPTQPSPVQQEQFDLSISSARPSLSFQLLPAHDRLVSHFYTTPPQNVDLSLSLSSLPLAQTFIPLPPAFISASHPPHIKPTGILLDSLVIPYLLFPCLAAPCTAHCTAPIIPRPNWNWAPRQKKQGHRSPTAAGQDADRTTAPNNATD